MSSKGAGLSEGPAGTQRRGPISLLYFLIEWALAFFTPFCYSSAGTVPLWNTKEMEMEADQMTAQVKATLGDRMALGFTLRQLTLERIFGTPTEATLWIGKMTQEGTIFESPDARGVFKFVEVETDGADTHPPSRPAPAKPTNHHARGSSMVHVAFLYNFTGGNPFKYPDVKGCIGTANEAPENVSRLDGAIAMAWRVKNNLLRKEGGRPNTTYHWTENAAGVLAQWMRKNRYEWSPVAAVQRAGEAPQARADQKEQRKAPRAQMTPFVTTIAFFYSLTQGKPFASRDVMACIGTGNGAPQNKFRVYRSLEAGVRENLILKHGPQGKKTTYSWTDGAEQAIAAQMKAAGYEWSPNPEAGPEKTPAPTPIAQPAAVDAEALATRVHVLEQTVDALAEMALAPYVDEFNRIFDRLPPSLRQRAVERLTGK